MAARRTHTPLQIKRAYVAPDASDGARVLVDRLWPRGCRREALQLRLWLRDLAPSDELRRWFGHDAARWPAFRERYLAELAAKDAALAPLRNLMAEGPVTLVYAAADVEHNNAVVLREYLLQRPA
ncbi:MAG TPA: DUF488 family protein [Rhodanobacteraceae bacterium]|nr:DUF488 family protein [Rhodanobacteraceae bacterium]